MRTTARYLCFGRPACMVFYFRVGHAPSREDCAAVNSNYVTWERGLFGFFGGNSDIRSADSVLVSTTTESIDRTGEAFSYTDLARVEGLVFGDVDAMVPTTLAPLVYWGLEAGAQRRPGRTYAVGVVQTAGISIDALELGVEDRLAIQASFDHLRAFMLDNGAQMVLPRFQVKGERLSPAPTYRVETCFNVDRYFSSRRRRSVAVVGGSGP